MLPDLSNTNITRLGLAFTMVSFGVVSTSGLDMLLAETYINAQTGH